jgi:catechol 2,3-dioxygenase-like lactoylglutathione lyase family enzyme
MELRPSLDRPDPGMGSDVLYYRDTCQNDLAAGGLSAARADEAIARYEAHMGLTFDEHGPGFVDGAGVWYAVPPGAVRMVTVNLRGPVHGRVGAFWNQLKWLVFTDVGGRVVLRLPNYGWGMFGLQRWAQRAGWDSEFPAAELKGDYLGRAWEAAFPGLSRSPSVPVGGPYTAGPQAATRQPRRWLRRRAAPRLRP